MKVSLKTKVIAGIAVIADIAGIMPGRTVRRSRLRPSRSLNRLRRSSDDGDHGDVPDL
jgi:hypothetical protein